MKNVAYKTSIFILGLFLSLAAYAQEVKKNPVRQTSADKEETVYKPQDKDKTKSKASSATGKQPQAKNSAPAPKSADKKAKGQKAKSKKQPAKQTAPSSYWALKTNAPMLAVDVKNIALEVQVHQNISIDFPVMLNFSDQSDRRAIRMVGFQPEGRWWLKTPGEGHFFGVHAHAAWFNVRWKDTRYQNEGRPLLGTGLSYGYKMDFGRHWGAEFNIGAGYANMKYNAYYNIDNGARLNTRIRHYWGITRLGVSLVYRL